MANPNDAVGTNGAFGGRTSVNAFNDVLSAFSGRGIISGWACAPSSGLTVTLGGNGADRDVAIAEDASGNKTTINNISQSPVAVTVNAAPASNSRIDSIVAYIEDSPNGSGITDNPDVVNLLVVSGSVASTPVAPNDSAIRSAITSDGASGSTAYYVVLANITIPTGTTDIDATMISAGSKVQLASNYIPDGAITADKLASSAVTAEKINFSSYGNTLVTAFGNSDSMPSITITPPANGRVLVLAITAATWGYGGGDLYLDIVNSSSAQQIVSAGGSATGGNSIGRQMVGYGVYGVNGGSSYQFTANFVGGLGTTTNVGIFAMWFPG